jgi:hypothetical protein
MKWSRLRGVEPETWALKGLRIRRAEKGWRLYEAQMTLFGIGPQVPSKSFAKLSAAKQWGKGKLEGL